MSADAPEGGMKPRADDFFWHGVALVVWGPILGVAYVVMAPFALIGWIAHRFGVKVGGS